MKGPDGYEIECTVEDIPACSATGSFDEEDEWHYDGHTDVSWDDQQTRTVCGATVYSGGEWWLEHHLIPDDADELSAAALKLMRREYVVGLAVDEVKKSLEAAKDASRVLGYDVVPYGPLEASLDLLKAEYDRCKDAAIEAKTRELDE